MIWELILIRILITTFSSTCLFYLSCSCLKIQTLIFYTNFKQNITCMFYNFRLKIYEAKLHLPELSWSGIFTFRQVNWILWNFSSRGKKKKGERKKEENSIATNRWIMRSRVRYAVGDFSGSASWSFSRRAFPRCASLCTADASERNSRTWKFMFYDRGVTPSVHRLKR